MPYSDPHTKSLANENARLTDGFSQLQARIHQVQEIVGKLNAPEDRAQKFLALKMLAVTDSLCDRMLGRSDTVVELELRPVRAALTLGSVQR